MTVTYTATNGTVSFDKAVVTLFDSDGNYAEDGTGHLTAAQIPTATAAGGYAQSSEYWTGTIGTTVEYKKPTEETAITADANYFVFFDPAAYTITVEVVNGTVGTESGELAPAEDGSYTITVNHNGIVKLDFTGNTGYALDSVTVDDKAGELSDGSYTFTKVSADHSIKVVYAEDKIGTDPENPDKGDGVPDKYQATVTYTATNGTVSFGKAVVTLFDGEGNPAENGTGYLTAKQIPTATAAEGYAQSSEYWTGTIGTTVEYKKPTEETAITADANYFVFFDPAAYTITVEVVNGTVGTESGELAPAEDGSYTITVNHNGIVKLDFTGNTGYALDSVTVDDKAGELSDGSYTFTKVSADHSIKVVYAEDKIGTDPENPDKGDGVPDKYQATVTYTATNGTVSFGKAVVTLFDSEGNYAEDGTGYQIGRAHV